MMTVVMVKTTVLIMGFKLRICNSSGTRCNACRRSFKLLRKPYTLNPSTSEPLDPKRKAPKPNAPKP